MLLLERDHGVSDLDAREFLQADHHGAIHRLSEHHQILGKVSQIKSFHNTVKSTYYPKLGSIEPDC